jgi:presenilin-like A22 family membrane protease
MKKTFSEKTKPLLAIAIIYILVQGIGLYISYTGPAGTPGIVGSVQQGTTPPMVQNGQNILASLQIFVYVIVTTAILLILIKYRLERIIPIMVYLGLFGGLFITLTGLFGDIGVILTLIVFTLAIWKRNNLLLTNIILILAIPGIGSWLGASLSFLPSLILLIGLSIYDLIAVFGTKHMITLAENAKGKIPLMIGVPVGEKMLGLGTGDLAIPLAFTISVLAETNLAHAVITSIGGLAGLLLLFAYILNKKDIMLPALPPLAAGLIIGYAAGFLMGI